MTAIVKKDNGNIVDISSPYALIDRAVASGANVDTLEKLMALNERYEANEARKAFFEAMQEFQRVKPELKRSSKVSFNTNKGTTEYNFCSLSDIERALKEPLSQCGLSYRFENFVSEDNLIGIRCIVSHVQGHSETTSMKAPVDGSGNKNGIQGIGSTSTYLMRYTLIAAFALTTADEDNDGQTNSDLPLQRVIQQNQALQNIETMRAVLAIKEALAEDDYYEACEYVYSMPEETLNSLWVASTKGGIFTVEERKKIKSEEFQHKKTEWFAEKDARNAQA